MMGEKKSVGTSIEGLVENCKLSNQLRGSCADENSFSLQCMCKYYLMAINRRVCLKISMFKENLTCF